KRIAPAAAAGGDDAHRRAGLDRDSVGHAGIAGLRSLPVDHRDLVGEPRLAAVDAVAGEERPVGIGDQPALAESADLLVVAEAAAAEAGTAGILLEAELLDQDRIARLGELCRQVLRVGHDVDDVRAVSPGPARAAAAEHLAEQIEVGRGPAA